MKIIGLIGGTSWESSAMYYRIINQTVRDRIHLLENAKSLMFTLNFHEAEQHMRAGNWDAVGEMLVDAAKRLEAGGADCVLLCSNTMHKLSSVVESAVKIPVINVIDETAREIKAQNIKRVGLLGTGFTMNQSFYKDRLETHNLEVMLPEISDRDVVDRIIFAELVQGKILEASKLEYVRIMQDLVDKGCEGIILGCTEIMLLVNQSDSSVAVFDTTTIHALAAVDFALEKGLK
jgi:aspartate racemase